MDRLIRAALLGGAPFLLMLCPTAAQACASCGCTLSSDWLSQGLAAQPGTSLSLRYDYIPQTSLASGTDSVDPAAITLPTDREIERYTYNHVVTATLDHQFASDWGIDVQLPYYVRPHSTFAEDTTTPSHSNSEGLGNLKAMVRWQGLSTPGHVTGLEAGLVLPTGGFHKAFDGGPEQGEAVDRGLQPGTGTVQAVLSAYHFGALGSEVDYFVQATGQFALDDREGYRPGTQVQATGALSYTHWRGLTPQLQVNLRATARDSGINADRPNSGGEQVNVSPGFSAKLGERLTGFGFVQLPLYTRVNGYQLVPRATLSVGLVAHL